MSDKPAVKKAVVAPDDDYSYSSVHVSSLPGYDPTWGLPSIAPPPETVPVVVPADPKES